MVVIEIAVALTLPASHWLQPVGWFELSAMGWARGSAMEELRTGRRLEEHKENIIPKR
jgi:hypothetical protein